MAAHGKDGSAYHFISYLDEDTTHLCMFVIITVLKFIPRLQMASYFPNQSVEDVMTSNFLHSNYLLSKIVTIYLKKSHQPEQVIGYLL